MTSPIQRQTISRPISAVRHHLTAAFTLIEVLMVVVIIGILVAISAPMINSLNSANVVTRNAYALTGALEQARSYATGNSTYTWLGVFEENADSPGTAGVGRVILAIFASTDGTNLYTKGGAGGPSLDSARLQQIGEMIQLEHTDLVTLSNSDLQRDTVPPSNHQVAEGAFAGSATVATPLRGGSGYTFSKLIQFNPLGDASRINESPARCIEFGLRPAKGNMADTSSKNLVAVQLAGIGGQTSIHRPQPPQP